MIRNKNQSKKYKDGIIVTALYGSSTTNFENIIDKENKKEYKLFQDKEGHFYYIKNKLKHYLMWG